MRSIRYAPPARKMMDRIQPAKRDDIQAAVARFAADPRGRQDNVKRLVGRKGAFRIRVGDQRVICELGAESLGVLDVFPRGAGY
jgi:mRNA-degrading endonuclease RelE of RelBE toxin-antitoxin system